MRLVILHESVKELVILEGLVEKVEALQYHACREMLCCSRSQVLWSEEVGATANVPVLVPSSLQDSGTRIVLRACAARLDQEEAVTSFRG